jgi:hypothetical protein
MFSRQAKMKLAQRATGALGMARSFLLLEDDYAVDWEVGQDELSPLPHPHRAPLRRRERLARRPGSPAPAPQLCLSPLTPTPAVPGRRMQARIAGRSGCRGEGAHSRADGGAPA